MRHSRITSSFAFALSLAAGAYAQFDPNPVLAAIPDNTALDLGEYTCTPIASEWSELCKGITDFSGFTYDRHRHQMLMFGGGHSTTMRDDVDVFDFETLTWNSAYPSTPCAEMIPENFDATRARWTSSEHPTSRHTYDLLVVTEGSGEFLLMRGGGNAGAACGRFDMLGGQVAHYDVDSGLWKFSGQSYIWNRFSAAEVDPVSDMVIIRSENGLYTYDPVNKIALEIDPANRAMGIANNLVYFPPNDKMYVIQRGSPTQVWEITLDRSTWSNSTTELVTGVSGDIPDSQESGWAYDSRNRIIGGGANNGVFYAYDPLAKEWKSAVMQPQSASGATVGTVAFHALDFDPVNAVFLFITDRVSGRRTWAYRYAGGPLRSWGDLNCDGRFDGADIDPFFLALGDPAQYQQQFPNCDILLGDINCDGALNGGDVDQFFTCLGLGHCFPCR